MKKLTLNLEALQVEQFELEPRRTAGRGTVMGQSQQEPALDGYSINTWPAWLCAEIPPTRSCFCGTA